MVLDWLLLELEGDVGYLFKLTNFLTHEFARTTV
jgi:hypothetical protein